MIFSEFHLITTRISYNIPASSEHFRPFLKTFKCQKCPKMFWWPLRTPWAISKASILACCDTAMTHCQNLSLCELVFHPSYIRVLYSSAIFSCKISCKVIMDTSRPVCAYSLWTTFCKHTNLFIAGKVWRCSVHVSRFIQSASYSWRSDIWSKEKLHKENGQKICCYCGFESTDELGTCRRYVVFINARGNGLVVI